MILIAPTYLDQMTRAAEAAYPRECCGLLVGKDTNDGFVTITKVVASDNVHPSGGNDRFEVDPRVRFDLMRELGEIGDKPRSSERIIGHYHSHPNHSAEPSAHALASATAIACPAADLNNIIHCGPDYCKGRHTQIIKHPDYCGASVCVWWWW